MNKWKHILKKIFFPPAIATIFLALFGYGFVLAVAVFDIEDPVLQYLSYLCSAYALVITITKLPSFITFVKSAKQSIHEHPVAKRVLGTAIGSRFFNDVRFRTELSLYQGLLVNSLYICLKLFSGIYYRSVWFISLSVYYALLAMTRFLLLRRGKERAVRTPMETELRRYRLCGVMLLLMNQALAGIVIFMVHQNKGFEYPGYLIYCMAMYSFYAVITAVVNLVKFRKHGSPILSAAKAINLVAAMVSILSLETAMMAQFGGNEDPAFRKIMTGATGGGVCTIVIAMAVFMIWNATKQLRKLCSNGLNK